LGVPPGQDEGGERLEFRLAVVDRLFQLRDPGVGDARLLQLLLHLLVIGRREQRAEREEVALDRREHLVDARHHLDGARHADHGVELVDLAVRLTRGWSLGTRPPPKRPVSPSSPVLV
jgi:hypothetical protein